MKYAYEVVSNPIDVDLLRSDLAYNPDDGSFTWKSRARDRFSSDKGFNIFHGKYAGRPAGSIKTNRDGHSSCVIRIGGVLFYAHRLAWAYIHGEAPAVIDHINGDATDNRIANLRPATLSVNNRNARMSRANTSGFNGVVYSKGKMLWKAQVALGLNGKRTTIHLGYFKTKDEASEARLSWDRANGFSERHGEPQKCQLLKSTSTS